MSFRGGGGRGGGGRGGFGGGRGGGRGGYQQYNTGPPSEVQEMGKFLHACEGEMVCESINVKVPQFNAIMYLENKTSVGKIDEVLGPINQLFFTIKPSEGIQATSFKPGDKFYIDGMKTLHMDRFLPKPAPLAGLPKVKKPKGAGGDRGRGGMRGRGSFGGGRGGRGGPSRGGFGGRGGGGGFGGRGGGGGGFGGRGNSGSGGFSRGGGRGRGGGGGFSRGGGGGW